MSMKITKNSFINIRCEDAEKEFISLASYKEGITHSRFVINASVEYAEKVLGKKFKAFRKKHEGR